MKVVYLQDAAGVVAGTVKDLNLKDTSIIDNLIQRGIVKEYAEGEESVKPKKGKAKTEEPKEGE